MMPPVCRVSSSSRRLAFSSRTMVRGAFVADLSAEDGVDGLAHERR